jgi:uncharacterized membrane protein YraQ (UPF0718 family)
MNSALNDLTVLFISILLEALPFLLLGSIIASLISLYVSDALLYRLIPKNRIGGLVVVSMLGIIFPVCDCTIIPVMRRLINKGLPPSLAVTFMCSVPIVNPSVIFSTYWAFANQPSVLWLRIIAGVWIAIAAGYLVGKITRDKDPLLKRGCEEKKQKKHASCGCGADHNEEAYTNTCDCGNVPPIENVHQQKQSILIDRLDYIEKKRSIRNKIAGKPTMFLNHVTHEFTDSAALIIIGAFLSAFIQILIPRTIMFPVASSEIGSVGLMMGFSWLISLCSNADAFVAKSFSGLFTYGSVIVFMIFGQMIDLKNTVVLLGFFKKSFVFIVGFIIAVLCFAWGIAINFAGRF